MLNGANVLVTGGAGFIGSNLILRLLTEGCRIRATLYNRPAVISSDSIEYVKADLTVMEDCRRVVEDMDFVFMCAANTSGAAVIADTPLVHVTPNIVMNAQLLEAAYHAHARKVLFVSTGAAYPPTDDRPVLEHEMFDGEPYEAYYAAGWMKRYTEILCRMYAQKITPPMSTVVVRPSNAYGPYDKFDFRTSHVTAALIRRVIERQSPIEVWGTGKDVRDVIYIDDLIDGMLLAFCKDNGHMAVNIAAGRGYTVKEILKTILNVDGYKDADVCFDPSKPQTIPVRLVDTTLAQNVLSFSASISLAEGIRRTAAWYREAFADRLNLVRA